MKGYSVSEGFMGYVEGEYMLFASEEDYRDYIEMQIDSVVGSYRQEVRHDKYLFRYGWSSNCLL